MRKFIILIFIVFFSSCWVYENIQDVYPEHFSSDSERSNHESLPTDIFNSLPGDFKLANQLGYLTTFIFPDASIAYKQEGDNYTKRRLITSQKLNEKYSELINNGYSVYVPIQFPHVICFYPESVDLIQRFEKEASVDLVMSLNLIHNNDSTLDLMDSEISHIVDLTNEASQKLETASKLVEDKQKEEQLWINRNLELQNKIKDIDNQIAKESASLKTISLNLDGTFSTSLYEHVNIESIPVTTRDDPFKSAHSRHQVDIKNKPYNTPNTSRNGYATLDVDMAKAMDKFYDKMKNPSSLRSEGFSGSEVSDLESWAKDQSNDIQLNSASRSPQHQLAIGNPKKAGTLNSKHMLGVAVDVQLNGKAYNPNRNRKGYDLMRKVAQSSGINFSLPADPVETMHAVLDSYQDGAAPNKAAYCGKLADLLSDYNAGISGELSNQDGQRDAKSKTKSDLNGKLSNLQGQIQSKLNQVNEINKKIGDLMQQNGMFSEQFQQKSNQLCSVLAAKAAKEKDKQKEQRSHEREYNHRDPRPSERPSERQREAPTRDRPNREAPGRERTREIGRSREIRPT